MSCYGSIERTKKPHLPYFPIEGQLKSGRDVKLIYYDETYEEDAFSILKKIVDDGDSYPQEKMDTVQDFRAYFLSHDCFCLVDSETMEALGLFYVKPNFPGRSSHLCNGGFMVKESARRQGVGQFMAKHYLQIARDLGYQGSFFNLVYVSNPGSVNLWRKLGFQQIGIIPKAGNLKGKGYVDAIQFYYDLTTISKTEL